MQPATCPNPAWTKRQALVQGDLPWAFLRHQSAQVQLAHTTSLLRPLGRKHVSMTAEVAVLNSTGVALAADSDVTISDGRGQKVY